MSLPIHRSTKKVMLVLFFILATFACNFITSNNQTPESTQPDTRSTASPALSQNLLIPDSTPMPNGLILVSRQETEIKLGSYQATYLEDKADNFTAVNQNKIEIYFDNDRTFTIRPDTPNQPLVWATGWCASDQTILSQNLKNIQFEMRVNGQGVDLEEVFTVDDRFLTGKYCHVYRIIISGWSSEITTLVSKTIINESVNNGIGDYLPGEFIRTYEIAGP